MKKPREEDASPSPTLQEQDATTPTAEHKRINFAAGVTTLVMPPIDSEGVTLTQSPGKKEVESEGMETDVQTFTKGLKAQLGKSSRKTAKENNYYT